MIPVIINNRDLMPQKLLRQILDLRGVGPIHLIDNASTYPPLLEWMSVRSYEFRNVAIWRNSSNGGPRAACRLVNTMRDAWTVQGIQYYATTDSDLDLEGVPVDALQVFSHELAVTGSLVKVGCALRIDDLPDTRVGRAAKWNEGQHWKTGFPIGFSHIGVGENRVAPAFQADIDTTFAVYRLNPPWTGAYGPSVRVAGEYQARHLPWYHTDENRPPDYQWYLQHADPTGTVYTAVEVDRLRPRQHSRPIP